MRLIATLVLVLLLAACQSCQDQPPSQAGSGEGTLAAHAATEGEAPAASENLLKGKVLEKLEASRYCYLRLATETGEVWAAVLQADVNVGDEVAVVNPMPMDGFPSPTLNRTFDHIVFGTLQSDGGQDAMQLLMDSHAGGGATSTEGPIKVEKASGPNGKTVEEIFARRHDLNGKKVVVRGKVTNVNPNIMGKTWIHIQDGTGDPEAKTNDLIVSSQTTPSEGDTVLVEGVLASDKSSGMGYDYPAIIEDATVRTE